MLLQGDYYLASAQSEHQEVIERFEEEEGYTSLLIIDPLNRIELHKSLCREDTNVQLLATYTPDDLEGEGLKRIYVHPTLDEKAKAFLVEQWGLLVLVFF